MAVLSVEEFICGGFVCEGEFAAVPAEFFIESHGDISEQGRFGEQSGVLYEVGAGGWAAAAGVNPFAVVSGGAGQDFGGRSVGFSGGFRDQHVAHEGAFVADVDG